jgi:hypothetical protein
MLPGARLLGSVVCQLGGLECSETDSAVGGFVGAALEALDNYKSPRELEIKILTYEIFF